MFAAALPFTPYALCERESAPQLLELAKAGDAAAFERLVALHEQLVLRFAQRVLLNREAARDAAQEVFLRLFRSLRRMDEGRELGPWLYRTTSNVCLDLLRRRREHLPIDLIAEPEFAGRTPEQNAARAEEERLLLAALQSLPARERQAIVLRDLEGYSTGEVAALLGSSETTVRSQISTGRVKLRNYMLRREGGLP